MGPRGLTRQNVDVHLSGERVLPLTFVVHLLQPLERTKGRRTDQDVQTAVQRHFTAEELAHELGLREIQRAKALNGQPLGGGNLHVGLRWWRPSHSQTPEHLAGRTSAQCPNQCPRRCRCGDHRHLAVEPVATLPGFGGSNNHGACLHLALHAFSWVAGREVSGLSSTSQPPARSPPIPSASAPPDQLPARGHRPGAAPTRQSGWD